MTHTTSKVVNKTELKNKALFKVLHWVLNTKKGSKWLSLLNPSFSIGELSIKIYPNFSDLDEFMPSEKNNGFGIVIIEKINMAYLVKNTFIIQGFKLNK